MPSDPAYPLAVTQNEDWLSLACVPQLNRLGSESTVQSLLVTYSVPGSVRTQGTSQTSPALP